MSANPHSRSASALPAASRRPHQPTERGYIRLFWRLFIPNAAVLAAASVVLIVAPPNGRVVVILVGLGLMLATNVLLMRRAFAPLERLSAVMQRVDPLQPGERAPLAGAQSEVSMLAHTFNQMLDRLERERRDSGRRAMLAEEAERRRVAADLHDEIGQSLTALVLQLKQAAQRDTIDPKAVGALADSAEDILDEVRSVARRLRPEALDDLGLRSALLALTGRMQDAGGLSVTTRIAPDLPALAPELELVIYRVTQEGLTNVLRHAEAQRADVELRAADGFVVLEIADDGGGYDADRVSSGEGLRGMRERALLVNATLTLDSRLGGGTVVRLAVPLTSTT